jgi:hypothetical protein
VQQGSYLLSGKGNTGPEKDNAVMDQVRIMADITLSINLLLPACRAPEGIKS